MQIRFTEKQLSIIKRRGEDGIHHDVDVGDNPHTDARHAENGAASCMNVIKSFGSRKQDLALPQSRVMEAPI